MHKVRHLLRLALVLFALLTVCGCRERAQKREEARLVEEARQARVGERITRLLKTARAAHDASNYEEALKAIDDALGVDPENAEVLELQKRVQFADKLDRLGAAKETADEKWTEVQAFDTNQGIGVVIVPIKPVAEAAATLYSAKKYDEAIANYTLLAEQCDVVIKLNSERERAKERRTDLEAAKAAAAEVNAAKDAAKLWSEGTDVAKTAATVYEEGKFVDAARMWKVAATQLADAEVWAEGVQSVRAAKAAYDADASKTDPQLLERFGGDPWAKTKQAIDAAQKLTQAAAWGKAVEAWEAAQAWLTRAAVTAINGKKKHERDQALANCKAVVARVQKSIKLSQDSPKTDKKLLTLIDGELADVEKCKTTKWYKLLRSRQRKDLDKATEDLLAEKFYLLHPDLVDVPDAPPVPLDGLAKGSKEAQLAQAEAAKAMRLPLLVRSRKAGIQLRLVPAGKFMMGSPESEKGDKDEDQHPVTISKAFYVGVCEITQGQWKQISRRDPSRFKDVGDAAPVEGVAWTEAQSFCTSLCKAEGVPRGTYRLPTEAEWEYACKAGTSSPFYTGKSEWDFARAGWCTDNSGGAPHAAGLKAPNAWGLHDMHGNVWEWCLDAPRTYTLDKEVADPAGDGHKARAIRGGGWYDKAWDGRSSNRGTSLRSGVSENDLGFRVIRLAVPIE